MSEEAVLASPCDMSKIPDFGDWGNGPDDSFTPDDQMRRIYFAGNAITETFWGTARVPPTWTMKRIKEHGLLRYASDVTVSFDILSLRHLVSDQ